MDYCFSLFNYPLGIIIIEFFAMCVSIISLVAETILSYWILNVGDLFWPSCHTMSVCEF